MKRIDVEKALVDPASEFDRPEAVLAAPGIGRREKLEILKRWRLDAELLSVADGEGMSGKDPASLLRRVDQALHSLESEERGAGG